MSMWLGERGSLAFKIGGDGKEVHLRQKRKQAYPERKVLLACMPSAQGVWWPKPHMKVRPISLAALWHHSAVSPDYQENSVKPRMDESQEKGNKAKP